MTDERTVPSALIVGGPNGAGKSTVATEYVRDRDHRYLSADRIAGDLNPENPEAAKIQAGKTFIRRLRGAIKAKENVVVESTLAGKGLRRMLERFHEEDYIVRIVFLFLDTPQLCIQRVRERVQQGGHDVPRSDIVRRFHRSIRNFWSVYRLLVDRWYLYYNGEEQFREVAFGEGQKWMIKDDALFDTFRELVASSDE